MRLSPPKPRVSSNLNGRRRNPGQESPNKLDITDRDASARSVSKKTRIAVNALGGSARAMKTLASPAGQLARPKVASSVQMDH